MRIIDDKGNSILRAANKIVPISDPESFRDVLGKVVPKSRFRVNCVQLTQTANTLAEDASETLDVDAKVTEILRLMASNSYSEQFLQRLAV